MKLRLRATHGPFVLVSVAQAICIIISQCERSRSVQLHHTVHQVLKWWRRSCIGRL